MTFDTYFWFRSLNLEGDISELSILCCLWKFA